MITKRYYTKMIKSDGIFEYWGGKNFIYGIVDKNTVHITIPEDVDNINIYGFYDCKKLQRIDVSEKNKNYTSVDGVLFNKNKTEMLIYPVCKVDKRYVMPDGVIGLDCFQDCRYLQNLVLPATMENIPKYAFDKLTNLHSIEVSEDNRKFSSIDGMVLNKDKTELLWYPKGRTEKVCVVPEGVKRLALSFEDNNLEEIVIPSTLDCPFVDKLSRANNLQRIDVADNNKKFASINGVLFSKDKTELLMCPRGRQDDIYTIPECVSSISKEAFTGVRIKNIIIPNNVKHIDKWAMWNACFKSVSVLDGVDCDLSGNTFACVFELEQIIVDERNQRYSSLDGVLFNKDKTELLKYPSSKSGVTYTIPESVEGIAKYAFMVGVDMFPKKIIVPLGTKAKFETMLPNLKSRIKEKKYR